MKTKSLHNQLVEWRQDLHMNPQVGFEEEFASNKVASLLKDFGLKVHKNIAKTGVVGVLKKGSSNKSIGIRADMDALPIQETNTFDYKSKIENRMHACGHDGHTTMLLGTAKHLTELEKTKKEFHGIYDEISCAEIYAQFLKGVTTDHTLELNQKEKERIFNLGYYTWVEQQNVDINHFEARRNQNFWEQHLKNMLALDEEIDKFNNL